MISLPHYSINKLEQELKEIVASELKEKSYELFFFGSRVKGVGDDRSDIDVGFYNKEGIVDRAKYNIKEKIENIRTLYSIDFVDFSKVDKEFKALVFQNREVFYEC